MTNKRNMTKDMFIQEMMGMKEKKTRKDKKNLYRWQEGQPKKETIHCYRW